MRGSIWYQRLVYAEKFRPAIQNALSHGTFAKHSSYVEFSPKTVYYEEKDNAIEVYIKIPNAVSYAEFGESNLPDDATMQIIADIKAIGEELRDNNASEYYSQQNFFVVNEGGRYTAKLGGYWVPKITNTSDDNLFYVDNVSVSTGASEASTVNLAAVLQYIQNQRDTDDASAHLSLSLQSRSNASQNQREFDDDADAHSFDDDAIAFVCDDDANASQVAKDLCESQSDVPQSLSIHPQSTMSQSHFQLIENHFGDFSDIKNVASWKKQDLCSNRYCVAGQLKFPDDEKASILFSIETLSICDINRQSIETCDLAQSATRVDYYCGPVLVVVTMIEGCIGTLGEVIKGQIKPESTIFGVKGLDFLISIAAQLLSTVKYYNDRGLIHGNVEPNNIFVVLCDSNSVQALIGYTWSTPTTNRHKPPVNHQNGRDPKEDVFSVASILKDLVMGQHEVQSPQKFETDGKNSPCFELAKSFGLHIAHFIEAALQCDVAKRPTAEEALDDLFYASNARNVPTQALREYMARHQKVVLRRYAESLSNLARNTYSNWTRNNLPIPPGIENWINTWHREKIYTRHEVSRQHLKLIFEQSDRDANECFSSCVQYLIDAAEDIRCRHFKRYPHVCDLLNRDLHELDQQNLLLPLSDFTTPFEVLRNCYSNAQYRDEPWLDEWFTALAEVRDIHRKSIQTLKDKLQSYTYEFQEQFAIIDLNEECRELEYIYWQAYRNYYYYST